MDVPLQQTHRDAASALWRQRQQWCVRPGIGARALRQLERRLHFHLHVLSRLPPAEEEPAQAEIAFVFLAAGLRSPDAGRRRETARLAADWLAGDAANHQLAARQALALHPGAETLAETRRLYEEARERRPELLNVWRIQQAEVPRGLLNQGELHAHDLRLQAAALRFCADWPAAGLSVFQPYYRVLGEDPFASVAELPVLAEALRGGLVRGDGAAALALRRAIERQAGSDEVAPLLRLAALSGEPDFQPVLAQHRLAEPASGCRLLALWGQREAVPELLEALETPQANAAAADAWQWLTGQRLPRRPRMQVVGEEAAPASAETIADAQAARAWWEAHKAAWPEGERRLLGRPLSPAVVRDALEEHAGAGAADALDLLALLTGRPAGVAEEDWLLRRDAVLAGIEEAPAVPPKRVAHA